MDAASAKILDIQQKAQNSSNGGDIWWMDREWEEAKKYMSEKQIARMEMKKAKSMAKMK